MVFYKTNKTRQRESSMFLYKHIQCLWENHSDFFLSILENLNDSPGESAFSVGVIEATRNKKILLKRFKWEGLLTHKTGNLEEGKASGWCSTLAASVRTWGPSSLCLVLHSFDLGPRLIPSLKLPGANGATCFLIPISLFEVLLRSKKRFS